MDSEWIDGKEVILYREQIIQVGFLEGLGEWVAIGASFEEDCDKDAVIEKAKKAIDELLDRKE